MRRVVPRTRMAAKVSGVASMHCVSRFFHAGDESLIASDGTADIRRQHRARVAQAEEQKQQQVVWSQTNLGGGRMLTPEVSEPTLALPPMSDRHPPLGPSKSQGNLGQLRRRSMASASGNGLDQMALASEVGSFGGGRWTSMYAQPWAWPRIHCMPLLPLTAQRLAMPVCSTTMCSASTRCQAHQGKEATARPRPTWTTRRRCAQRSTRRWWPASAWASQPPSVWQTSSGRWVVDKRAHVAQQLPHAAWLSKRVRGLAACPARARPWSNDLNIFFLGRLRCTAGSAAARCPTCGTPTCPRTRAPCGSCARRTTAWWTK